AGKAQEEGESGADVLVSPPHAASLCGRVPFAGEVVAMVMAETSAAARDGADRVTVEWAPLPAVMAGVAAAAPGAPVLYQDAASNVCTDSEGGDAAAVDAAFGRASHVVRLETWVHRVTGVPMEPRAAVGAWDPIGRRYTVHAGAGGLWR